jgi:hypothetical protein
MWPQMDIPNIIMIKIKSVAWRHDISAYYKCRVKGIEELIKTKVREKKKGKHEM